MCRILRCFFAALILLSTSAASTGIFLTPQTEHVWVVFKTHFDIGYTARVADVLARYRGPMVDNAMAVIAKNRTSPSGQRFSWTVPGWPLTRIIDDQQTPDRRAKVIEALKEGSLAVHALPFSMHTESLDIEDLVRGLHFSSQIARDLGKPLPDRGEDDRRAQSFLDPADAAAPRRHPLSALGLQRGLAVSAGAAAFLVGRARRLADPLRLHARLRLAAHPGRRLAGEELPGHDHGRRQPRPADRRRRSRTSAARSPPDCPRPR